jgi:uncharacterized membrane protein
LAGVVGSALLAYVSVTLGLISGTKSVVACLVAAFVATTAESYIGAIFQDNVKWLNNEIVNLINTIIGALVAITIARFL